MTRFNLTFRGKILAGHDRQQVEARLAELFAITEPARLSQCFSGDLVILRRDLNRKDAADFYARLRRMGLEAELVKIPERNGVGNDTPSRADPAAEVAGRKAEERRRKKEKKAQRAAEHERARVEAAARREAERAARAEERARLAELQRQRREEEQRAAAEKAAQRDALRREREQQAAQARLEAARRKREQAAAAANPSPADNWDRASGPTAAVKVPYGKPSEWDLTLPAVPSAFLSGDPIQIINAVLQIAQNSYQVTQQLGKKFLQQLGILKPTDTGITNGGGIPMVYGNQAIEYVIKRAQSQIGVPYSWGGGTAAGPSRGIDSGANTVGFDCSGLVLYAFAGAGIKLPHYSGSQYNLGRKIPTAQMRRGDVLFWGPNGSQHVAIFLGNGQMIEAPYTGSTVKISPVRTSGMTPFAVRYIEW